MGKEVSVLTLMSALLLSVVVAFFFASPVKANPIWLWDYPLEPIMTPPVIIVYSPVQNQNYTGDAQLNFTITKPESWFYVDSTDRNGNNPSYLYFGSFTRVYYIMDNGEQQNLTLQPQPYFGTIKDAILNFTFLANASAGTHSIKVGFEAHSFYRPGGVVADPPYIVLNGSSEVISFNVESPSEPEPRAPEQFPTLPVVTISGASALVIAAGLIVYSKKIKAHKPKEA